ncbi:hypothetical protein SEA_OTTAWA_8 [Arthrobacter phage Ottawa]|nr:hypothetical protein SEA_KHARCHO_8 [Arthrobacter phage Kharcho]WIC89240.1 hypothetical protein SEA_OTTAWA_8 [Arthrobacter phage Ottawa]
MMLRPDHQRALACAVIGATLAAFLIGLQGATDALASFHAEVGR